MSKATDLFAAERERQVTEEGYTPEHDVNHAGELALAGDAYALAAADSLGVLGYAANDPAHPTFDWPWDKSYWKPTGDPVRDLVKAGGLIAAALDSLLDGSPDE